MTYQERLKDTLIVLGTAIIMTIALPFLSGNWDTHLIAGITAHPLPTHSPIILIDGHKVR